MLRRYFSMEKRCPVPASCTTRKIKQFNINVGWTVLFAARALRKKTSDDAVLFRFGDALQGLPARVRLGFDEGV